MSTLDVARIAFGMGILALICRILPIRKKVEFHYVPWAHSTFILPKYIAFQLDMIWETITLVLLWNMVASTPFQTVLLLVTKVALVIWAAETLILFFIGQTFRILVAYQICPSWVPDAITLFVEFLNGKVHSSEFPEEDQGYVEDEEGYNYARDKRWRIGKGFFFHVVPLIYLYVVYFT